MMIMMMMMFLQLSYLQCTLVNVFVHLDDVEGREDARGSGPHVVTLTPQVLGLLQQQHRVVRLQLKLIRVTGDEPEPGTTQQDNRVSAPVCWIWTCHHQPVFVDVCLTCRRRGGSAVAPLHPKHRRTHQNTRRLNTQPDIRLTATFKMNIYRTMKVKTQLD